MKLRRTVYHNRRFELLNRDIMKLVVFLLSSCYDPLGAKKLPSHVAHHKSGRLLFDRDPRRRRRRR